MRVWDLSSVGLEHYLDKVGVVGSIPTDPTADKVYQFLWWLFRLPSLLPKQIIIGEYRFWNKPSIAHIYITSATRKALPVMRIRSFEEAPFLAALRACFTLAYVSPFNPNFFALEASVEASSAR